MHMMLVTHLGPSPLDLPPSCPVSTLSIPATCCILLLPSCIHCMFIWVVQCTAICSSHTVHTWSCVHWVWIHLVQVDHLPLQCHQCRHLPQTSESTGFNFVSPKNGTSDLTLTLRCTTDICTLGACTSTRAFPFPFPLPDTASLLSNLVGLNDMDSVAHRSSSTCRASSAFCIASSHHTSTSIFHLAHNRSAFSILVTMWPATCGSIP